MTTNERIAQTIAAATVAYTLCQSGTLRVPDFIQRRRAADLRALNAFGEAPMGAEGREAFGGYVYGLAGDLTPGVRQILRALGCLEIDVGGRPGRRTFLLRKIKDVPDEGWGSLGPLVFQATVKHQFGS